MGCPFCLSDSKIFLICLKLVYQFFADNYNFMPPWMSEYSVFPLGVKEKVIIAVRIICGKINLTISFVIIIAIVKGDIFVGRKSKTIMLPIKGIHFSGDQFFQK